VGEFGSIYYEIKIDFFIGVRDDEKKTNLGYNFYYFVIF